MLRFLAERNNALKNFLQDLFDMQHTNLQEIDYLSTYDLT
jgi:hypothetical protein